MFYTFTFAQINSDCSANPCVHGMCSNSVTGYRCTCQTGYHGSLCDTCKY
jgi:hypothetical protein